MSFMLKCRQGSIWLLLLVLAFSSQQAGALDLRAYTVAGSGELHLTLQEGSGSAVVDFPFLVIEGLQWAASTGATGPGTPLDEFVGNLGDQNDVGLALPEVATDVDPGAQQLAASSPFLLLVFVSPGTLANIIPIGGDETYLGSVMINGDETNPELGFLDSDQNPLQFELIVLPEPALAALLGVAALALINLRRRTQGL